MEIEKRCRLSREGWILAPSETEESFLQRKATFDQIDLPKEKNLSISFYDLCIKEAIVVYSNESLWPWQGAVLWEYSKDSKEKYPVIQLRTSFLKKEEVLAHELVHAVRFFFKEPFFEEMFAYQTSSHILKRFFGPIFIYPIEASLFAAFSLVAPLVAVLFDSFYGVWLLLVLGLFFALRLFVLHGFFSLCKRKLEKTGVSAGFSLAVMVRLSDREIVKIALSSSKKNRAYFEECSKKDLRLQVIFRSYF